MVNCLSNLINIPLGNVVQFASLIAKFLQCESSHFWQPGREQRKGSQVWSVASQEVRGRPLTPKSPLEFNATKTPFFIEKLGGGNSNSLFLHPYLGKVSNLTNIFQRGWNHPLENHWINSRFLDFQVIQAMTQRTIRRSLGWSPVQPLIGLATCPTT